MYPNVYLENEPALFASYTLLWLESVLFLNVKFWKPSTEEIVLKNWKQILLTLSGKSVENFYLESVRIDPFSESD